MPQTVFYPREIILEKVQFVPEREVHSQYVIALSYELGRTPVVIHDVHLPADIVAAINGQTVCALWLDRLEPNSLASRLLPEQPEGLVACVQLKNGTLLRAIPPELYRARSWLFAQFAVLFIVAAGILGTAHNPHWAWGGAVLLACALERLQTCHQIPVNKSRTYRAVTATNRKPFET